MADPQQTIAEVLNAWIGGALTTLFGVGIGQAMYHAQQVKSQKRKPFSKELIWELPVAVGVGMITDAITSYMGFSSAVSTGIAVGLGYLGPRGIEVLFIQWANKKSGQ